MKLRICTFKDKTQVLIYGELEIHHIYGMLGTGFRADGRLILDYILALGIVTSL